MPLNIYESVRAVYKKTYSDLDSTIVDKSKRHGQELGDVIHAGFTQLLVNVTISGAIPGVPPVPYTFPEPPFTPTLNNLGLVSFLQNKYYELYSNFNSTVIDLCNREADAISNGVYNYFSQAIYIMKVHIGNLTPTILPASIIKGILLPQLISIYSTPSRDKGSLDVKLTSLGNAIQSSLMSWISGIIYTGIVGAIAPAIPLIGGTATGIIS